MLVSMDVTTVVAYKVVVKVCAGPTGVQEAVTVAPGSVTCWLFVSLFLESRGGLDQSRPGYLFS
jgi:hypothetical protein